MRIGDLLPKVHTSEGGYIFFDEQKIVESLEMETGLNEEDSVEVAKTTARQLITLNPSFLATPQIREWVCIVLQGNGHSEERKRYTRRGMSSAEIEKFEPRSQKIKDEIKLLQFLGLWNNKSVGGFVYNVLKDHYALDDPNFMIMWKVHRFLKVFKSFIRNNTVEELVEKSERYSSVYVKKRNERKNTI